MSEIRAVLKLRVPRTIPDLQEIWELEADSRGVVWNVGVQAEKSNMTVMVRACLHVDPAFDHWFTQRQAQSFADGSPGESGREAEEGFLGCARRKNGFPGLW